MAQWFRLAFASLRSLAQQLRIASLRSMAQWNFPSLNIASLLVKIGLKFNGKKNFSNAFSVSCFP